MAIQTNRIQQETIARITQPAAKDGFQRYQQQRLNLSPSNFTIFQPYLMRFSRHRE